MNKHGGFRPSLVFVLKTDALSLQIVKPLIASRCYVQGGMACDGGLVSPAAKETREWNQCKLTGEVRADMTETYCGGAELQDDV